LQQDLTTRVQKKYLISVGLILKNMHMQGISRPFLRRVNGKKFKLKRKKYPTIVGLRLKRFMQRISNALSL